ncbi:MAG: HU family DNA-binding protein [Candidatus Sulfotelmatobacter sp.]
MPAATGAVAGSGDGAGDKADWKRRGTMTKADLIDEVSHLAELTRKDSEVIVETIFDSVVRSLRAGDKIEIRGFGSFRTRQRKPRTGRNPKTGEKVEVPAKKIPFFKPSKELKDLVNEGIATAAATTPAPLPPAGPPT